MKKYYTFIGDTDKGLGYVKGRSYALVVGERNFMQRVSGVLLGIPKSWRVIITSPIICPYDSWESFNENWKYEYAEISD